MSSPDTTVTDKSPKGAEPPLPRVEPGAEREAISFDQAISQHDDIGKLLERVRAAYGEMATINNELAASMQSGLEIPNGPHKLFVAQKGFGAALDEVYGRLLDEKDENSLRHQLLKRIYSEFVAPFQAMVLQLHVLRMSMIDEKRMHEKLITEANALIDRVKQRS